MSEAERFAPYAADRAMSTYSKRDERAALRCALGDAAALCDTIAADIIKEKGTRGIRLAEIATRCGDAISAMRELVRVPTQGETG